MKTLLTLTLFIFGLPSFARAQNTGPIIDMHMHAYPPDIFGPLIPNPVSGVGSRNLTEADIRRLTLEAMNRHNIVTAVLSGPLDVVGRWLEVAPSRFLGSPHFPFAGSIIGRRFTTFPVSLDSLRELYTSKRLGAMAEVTSQYAGMTPSDDRLEPYLALAEELDIPVGIHVGLSGRGVTFTEHPDFRIANGRPLLLEPMLVRHPKLRLYVMHAGWPFLDEMKAILWSYPEVYVDIAVMNWFIPRAEFHRYLRELVDAGFGERIMFGSDQMVWPDAIGLAIDGIESATFLSQEAKRDIFYNNAARFLRLAPIR